MRVKAVIDRFEERKAVILLGDEEVIVSWPRSILPENVQEGDILQINISIDAEATRAARSEANDLLRQILQRNQEG